MKSNFAEFRKKEEVTQIPLKEEPVNRKMIKEFLIKKEGISENGLVSLVILYNTSKLNEDYKEELEVFELVKEGKITKKGEDYLNDPKIIEKLKSMI